MAVIDKDQARAAILHADPAFVYVIDNLPGVDAEPVVYCEDCAYCKKVDQYELWCHGFCNPPRLVAADDFCSHGREAC